VGEGAVIRWKTSCGIFSPNLGCETFAAVYIRRHCSLELDYSPHPPAVRKIWTTSDGSDTTNAGKANE